MLPFIIIHKHTHSLRHSSILTHAQYILIVTITDKISSWTDGFCEDEKFARSLSIFLYLLANEFFSQVYKIKYSKSFTQEKVIFNARKQFRAPLRKILLKFER